MDRPDDYVRRIREVTVEFGRGGVLSGSGDRGDDLGLWGVSAATGDDSAAATAETERI